MLDTFANKLIKTCRMFLTIKCCYIKYIQFYKLRCATYLFIEIIIGKWLTFSFGIWSTWVFIPFEIIFRSVYDPSKNSIIMVFSTTFTISWNLLCDDNYLLLKKRLRSWSLFCERKPKVDCFQRIGFLWAGLRQRMEWRLVNRGLKRNFRLCSLYKAPSFVAYV